MNFMQRLVQPPPEVIEELRLDSIRDYWEEARPLDY